MEEIQLLALFFSLMTPFPDKAFIIEEVTCCINEAVIGPINEAAIDAIIVPRNEPSCFFYLMFYCLSRTIT